MKRVWPIVAVIAVLAAVGLATSPTRASSSAAPSHVRHVVVVLAPYLVWSDVTATTTPALWRLAEKGAVGSVNARSRIHQPGEPASPDEGALSISAGSWAVPDFLAPAPLTATETHEATSAAVAYEQIVGAPMGDARIGFLGIRATQRANTAASLDVTLGTLGKAIRDANGLTAAVGNSDAGYASNPADMKLSRPAALAAMDERGLVPYGDVSPDLLSDVADAAYGRATDLQRFEAAYERVNLLADAHNGPSLIVLDPGDAYRARRFAPQASDAVGTRQHADALRTLDAVVSMAEKRSGPDTVVMVVSQALYADQSGALEGFGPMVVAGPGWAGYLTSASTHRQGLVTNIDVTAGVLQTLAIQRPVQVLGSTLQVIAGPSAVAQRVERLARSNDVAIATDEAKAGVLRFYIGFVVIVMALSALAVSRSHRWSYRTARNCVVGLKAAALFLLAVPLASWLMFVVTPVPVSQAVAVDSLMGTSVALWLLSLIAWRKLPSRVVIALLPAATVLVLVADQLFGAPLSFTNFFGYSPLLAARFYGMGNEAASLVFGAAVVSAALVFDQWPHARWSLAGRRYGLAALGVLVVGTSAAPFFGANVGVAVWGIAGFSVALALMNGRCVTWKLVLLTIVAMVVVIGAFSAIDLFGSGEQTHLGRALSSAQQGGAGQLWTILIRKAQTNARVFSHTNWSTILVAVLAFLGFMRLRPKPDLTDTLAENPYFAYAIAVTIVAGVTAFFSEDSGIVIPALIMLYTGVTLAWLMLSRLLAPAEARR